MKITLTALIAIAGSSTAGTFVTDWNSGGFEGWTTLGNNGGTWTNPGVGGNLGGYMQYEDAVAGGAAVNELLAPSQYLGNYESYENVGYFEYDVIHVQPAINPIDYPRVRLFGANGEEAFSKGGFIVDDNWTTLRFDIVESDFEMVTGTWAGLLSDVTELRISGDNAIGSGLESGIDNFKLSIPAPGVAFAFAGAGLAAARRRR